MLLEDFPGTGKTQLARALSATVQGTHSRIQFTPDLLPSDVTGVNVFNQRTNGFELRHGPVFANVLLVDEINRASPKTQAALLEAMQESQVTIEGTPHALGDIFIVIATQNPIEYEGTYPLPEAQLDRFLLKVDVDYPDEEGEKAMLRLRHHGVAPATLADVETVLDPRELQQARADVDSTGVSDEVVDYVIAIGRASCRERVCYVV